jgi:hypothetical protein
MDNNTSNTIKTISSPNSRGYKNRKQFQADVKDSYLLQSVQTDSMAYPNSSKMVTGDSFSGGKAART